MRALQVLEQRVIAARLGVAKRNESMFRVGIAVAGDLLLDPIKQSLKENLVTEPCVVQNIAQLMAKLSENAVDALILDDQFDYGSWIGNLVVAIKEKAPHIAIIIIGTFADGVLIYELLDLGISSYLYRGDDLRPLFEVSLRSACLNKPYLSPTASSEYTVAVQSGRCQQWALEPESKSVLRMLAAGKSVNEIAAVLHIAPRRVYWLRSKLRQRFKAETNEALVAAAGLQGYLRTSEAIKL